MNGRERKVFPFLKEKNLLKGSLCINFLAENRVFYNFMSKFYLIRRNFNRVVNLNPNNFILLNFIRIAFRFPAPLNRSHFFRGDPNQNFGLSQKIVYWSILEDKTPYFIVKFKPFTMLMQINGEKMQFLVRNKN
jgi:hypothetical protein